jgi:two-component system nitrate/nitrite response regulator NarL
MLEKSDGIDLLLVDDHALFREGIGRLLTGEPGFNVVGNCGSIDQAITVLRERHVDLVLLDFDLGERDGLDFMRVARQCCIDVKVLIVTAGVEPARAADLIRAGISGIFMKRHSPALLANSIRDIMTGRVSFDEDVFQKAITGADTRHAAQAEPFTSRERHVLSCLLEGLANKEIAGRIRVSESSVKATLQQLFAKTGVRTRSQLVRIALEHHKNDL